MFSNLLDESSLTVYFKVHNVVWLKMFAMRLANEHFSHSLETGRNRLESPFLDPSPSLTFPNKRAFLPITIDDEPRSRESTNVHHWWSKRCRVEWSQQDDRGIWTGVVIWRGIVLTEEHSWGHGTTEIVTEINLTRAGLCLRKNWTLFSFAETKG